MFRRLHRLFFHEMILARRSYSFRRSGAASLSATAPFLYFLYFVYFLYFLYFLFPVPTYSLSAGTT
jgi:hypothetical protein